MKRNDYSIRLAVLAVIWAGLCLNEAQAACRNPNVVQGIEPLIRRVAALRFAQIKRFGHAFFQITSSAGTRIIGSVLRRFLEGPYPARFLDTNAFSVSSDTLPRGTEIIIPKVAWFGWDDD